METRRIVVVTVICILVLTGVLLLAWPGDAKQQPKGRAPSVRLLAHAGAGIQPPLDELGAMFTEKTGTRIDYSYKGSGCLLPDICVAQKGDLYIPGELFYMQQGIDRGIITQYRPVAQMSTVLIAQKGNPKGIRGVEDLGRPGTRVGMGDAKAIAIGRAAKTVLDRAKCARAVEKNTVMCCMNVVELGNAIKLRQLDAAIVWDGTAALYGDQITTIPIPADLRETSTIPVGVLKYSKHPKEATRFMSFLASPEAALVFKKHGYQPVKAPVATAKAKKS